MPTPEIITLAEVKEWLRVDSDHEDDTLAILIAAATEDALDYADTWDSGTEPPARLKLAVLAHIAQAWEGDRLKVAAPDTSQLLARPYRTLDV